MFGKLLVQDYRVTTPHLHRVCVHVRAEALGQRCVSQLICLEMHRCMVQRALTRDCAWTQPTAGYDTVLRGKATQGSKMCIDKVACVYAFRWTAAQQQESAGCQHTIAACCKPHT
jgi:hypothetical protein